jgi:DNA-binding MarR family transcriptional regulator
MRRATAERGKAAVASEAFRGMAQYVMRWIGPHSDVLQELGLTPGHLRAMMLLEPNEPRTMGSLAKAWACDPSNITWLVDRLEERGLVERRSLATDRRVKTVVLTPLGEKAKADMLERLYEPPPDLLALSIDDLRRLASVIEKLPVE